jgi:hypothetical protein
MSVGDINPAGVNISFSIPRSVAMNVAGRWIWMPSQIFAAAKSLANIIECANGALAQGVVLESPCWM